jgi:spore maturation protein CgeB
VLLYGQADVPGSGAWCYYETLRDTGHEVEFFSDRTAIRTTEKSLGRRLYRKLFRGEWEPDRRRHLRLLLAAAQRFQPDIVIILKGLQLGPREVDALRRSAWTVNINHDDFFSRNRNNWTPRQRASIGSYDYVFVTREVNVAEVRPINSNVEFFQFAYYPRIHRPVLRNATLRDDVPDVLFIGTWEKSRAKLLEELVSAVPARYSVWGTQWEKLSPTSSLRSFVRQRQLVGDDMAAAISQARISLGFLRKANRDEYTQRSFEIPACGGLLLAERTPSHQRLFREGIEAEFFDPDDPTELITKVRQLLVDDVRRERIRAAGTLAVTRGHHTYADRLQRLMELYETRKSPAA